MRPGRIAPLILDEELWDAESYTKPFGRQQWCQTFAQRHHLAYSARQERCVAPEGIVKDAPCDGIANGMAALSIYRLEICRGLFIALGTAAGVYSDVA